MSVLFIVTLYILSVLFIVTLYSSISCVYNNYSYLSISSFSFILLFQIIPISHTPYKSTTNISNSSTTPNELDQLVSSVILFTNYIKIISYTWMLLLNICIPFQTRKTIGYFSTRYKARRKKYITDHSLSTKLSICEEVGSVYTTYVKNLLEENP